MNPGIWLDALHDILSTGRTPVLYTERQLYPSSSPDQTRYFSSQLALTTSRLVSFIAPKIGYLISKGGTTTQTFLRDGLNLESVFLEGQLMPGLSLVRPSSGRVSSLPIVTFPGNLGTPESLLDAWKLMEFG